MASESMAYRKSTVTGEYYWTLPRAALILRTRGHDRVRCPKCRWSFWIPRGIVGPVAVQRENAAADARARCPACRAGYAPPIDRSP